MQDTISQQISTHLRVQREQCGLTQKQVADMIGTDRSTYSCYEAGKITPSIDIIMKLALCFHVEYTDLLASEDITTCFRDVDGSPFHLSTDEMRLVFSFRSMKEEDRKALLENLNKQNTDSELFLEAAKVPHFAWDEKKD